MHTPSIVLCATWAPLTAADVVLQKTPATFDVSVWELFGTLITGAHLVIAEPDGHRDPDYLARVIAEGDVIAPSARIEAMYEPEKHGLSATQRIKTLPSAAGGNVAIGRHANGHD